jgi:hypothetical protein
MCAPSNLAGLNGLATPHHLDGAALPARALAAVVRRRGAPLAETDRRTASRRSRHDAGSGRQWARDYPRPPDPGTDLARCRNLGAAVRRQGAPEIILLSLRRDGTPARGGRRAFAQWLIHVCGRLERSLEQASGAAGVHSRHSYVPTTNIHRPGKEETMQSGSHHPRRARHPNNDRDPGVGAVKA